MMVLALAMALTAGEPSRPPLADCAADPGLTISGTISGYQAGKGLFLALYRSAADFAGKKYCRTLRFLGDKLPADSLRYAFTGVAPGEYMIACFQDMDGDGKMTTGMFGIPKDPYRIVLPNHGFFGPKFDRCKFTVKQDYTSANMDFAGR